MLHSILTSCDLYFSTLDIKLYKLKIAVRGHVSMMLICNAVGEALPPIYAVSGSQLKQNILKGSPPGTLTIQIMTLHRVIFVDSCNVFFAL